MKKIVYGLGIAIVAMVMFVNVSLFSSNEKASNITLGEIAEACQSVNGEDGSEIPCMDPCAIYLFSGIWVGGCEDGNDGCNGYSC